MNQVELVDIRPAPSKPVTFSWTAPDNNGHRVSNQNRPCPWPEWSDSVVNNERWGMAAPKPKEKKQATAAASTLSPNELFEEPMGKRFLFPDMEASTWVRLSQYFSSLEESGPVTWDEQEFVFDVLAPNKHLVRYKVIRQMISVLHALWELGNTGVLVNANFVAGGVGGVGRLWRPWSLVYSMCRAGPGVPHQPLFNPSGKYLVRLFVLGCWRQVCVDDWCPLDRDGRPLLLRSMKLTELWPLILSKALLQVLSAGRRSSGDVEGHEIVTMLTGCMELTVYMRHMKAEEVWNMMQDELLPRYTWPEPPAENVPNVQSATSSPRPANNKQKPVSGEASATVDKKGKTDKAKSKKPQSQPSAEEKPEESESILQLRRKPFVLAMMEDVQNLFCSDGDRDVPLDSELPHLVLVSRYRDIPLEKPPPRPPTPPWKNVRRYLWDPDLTNPPRPIQMLEVHTPLLDVSPTWTVTSSELTTDVGDLVRADTASLTAEQSPTSGTATVGGLLTSDSARGPVASKTTGTSDQPSEASSKPAASSTKPSGSSSKPTTSSTKHSRSSKQAHSDSSKHSKTGSKEPVAIVDTKPSKASSKSNKHEKATERKPSATQSLCHQKPSRQIGRVMSPSAPSIIMANIKETKTWIHMDEFCKVFNRLHLFYSPTAVRNQCVLSDLVAAPAPPPPGGSGRGERDREKAAKSTRQPSASSRVSDGEHSLRRLDHNEPLYVFLDTLESSRIFISLQVAPPEPPPEPPELRLSSTGRATAENVKVSATHPVSVETPTAITTESHSASLTTDASATPSAAETPRTLSEHPASSVVSTELSGTPAAAPSVQAAGTTPLVTARSEPPPPESAPARAEPEPEPSSESQPEPEQAEPPPERRGAAVVSEFCWSSVEPGRVLLTLGRRTPDSGAICLPAGRHVIQLLVTSGRGYALQLGSSSQFRCGTIRELVRWLAEPPRRYLKAGSDVSDGLLQLMQNFIAETPSDHKEKMLALCRIFCPETKPEEKSLRTFYQETFMKCLCEILPQLLGGTLSSESAFSWRCFLMDANHSMQCRRAGSPSQSKDRPKSKQRATQGKKEVGKTGSTPAAKRTGKPAKDDTDRRNGADDDIISKGYGSVETAAAVQLQAFARRLLARRMLRSHRRGTADHQRVTAEMQRAAPLLQQQADKLATEVLRRMLEETRPLMPRYHFFPDLFHTASCTEMSGSAPEAGQRPWFLLFRLCFRVNSEQTVAVRPYVSAGFPIRTHLFDLDNKCLLDPVRHTGYPIQASKSTEGLCLVAEALPQEARRPASDADGRWTCWLLDQVQDRSLFTDTKHISLAGCAAAFHTREVAAYYRPRPDQVVFDFYMRAGKGHQLTLQMEASHHKALVKVQVLDFENKVIASAEGVGQAVIPLLVMDGEEYFIPSTTVHGGHDGKKKASPSKKERGGAVDSPGARKGAGKGRSRPPRAGGDPERWAGDSGSSSSGDVSSRPPRPDHWDRYRLLGRVQADTWPLSRRQWSFVHKLTQEAVTQQYIHGPFEFRSQVVLPTNKKPTKKSRNPPASKGKAHAAPAAGGSPVATDTAPEPVKSPPDIDKSRPHVTLRLVSTEQRAEEIELFHNNDHISAIKLEKAAWETAGAGRAERAKKLRLEYLDGRTCRLPADWPSPPPAAPSQAAGDARSTVVAHAELATLPSSEEFEPLPEGDVETTEDRGRRTEPDREPEPERSEQEQPERSSDRSRGPELEPELLFVTPQLPPEFVLNEVDTELFLRDEPKRLSVCDDQFKAEENRQHERCIDDFTRRWSAVGDFMVAEHGSRETAKLDQMTSLHDSLKPSVRYRAFADVMRDNYRIKLAETTASAQHQPEPDKAGKKKKK